MESETTAYLFEEGGKLASSFLKMVLTKPRKIKPDETIEKTSVATVEKPVAAVEVKTVQSSSAIEKMQIPVQSDEVKSPGTPISDEIAYRWECCMPSGTKLYGASSIPLLNKLSAINDGRKYSVLTHTGHNRTPTAWMSRPYNGRMIDLGFYYCNIPLRLTPEHELLGIGDVREPQSVWRYKDNPVLNEDNLNWIPAGEFTNKSFIAFPRIQDTQDMELLTPEFAEFIGWYVAEGNVDKSSGAITISFSHDETTNIMRVVYLISHLLGKEPRIDNGGTATRITFSCEPMAVLLKQFGQGAINKTLPVWFVNLPAAKQYAFLRGYILGDGCVSPMVITCTTSSEHLAYMLRLILFRLGILHGLKQHEVPDSIIDGRIIHTDTPRNDITISGDAARLLDKYMGLTHDFGNKTSGNFGWVGEKYILIPAREVSDEYFSGNVYNIEVEKDNSYLTIHGAAHNCCKHLGGASVLLREAYERSIGDEGVGPGTAEKVMEAMNEHSAMELDIEKMLSFPEAREEAQKLLDATRKFRRAAWDCHITTGQGTVDDIEAAKLWNDILYQTTFANAKLHPGSECQASGM